MQLTQESYLDQSFQPNTPGSKMPVFNPIDNATGHVDMEKHCKKDLGSAVKSKKQSRITNSVYSWGASGPIHESAIRHHVEGVYFSQKCFPCH